MRSSQIGAVLICLAAAAGSGCTQQLVAESSACRNLVYKNGEVPRAEYLPCVGETMAVLDELDKQTEAALGGDRKARSAGRSSLRQLIALRQLAGGMQLLERRNDKTLVSLNVDIHNALTHYDAFYMLPILKEPDPFAQKSFDAAKAELDGGHRNYLEASRLYRFLK